MNQRVAIDDSEMASLCAMLGVTVDVPEFCSLDHVAELSAECGDPFTLCAAMEAQNGFPLAFSRDFDDSIYYIRRTK